MQQKPPTITSRPDLAPALLQGLSVQLRDRHLRSMIQPSSNYRLSRALRQWLSLRFLTLLCHTSNRRMARTLRNSSWIIKVTLAAFVE